MQLTACVHIHSAFTTFLKRAVLPKLIYRFNEIPTAFFFFNNFTVTDKLILKFRGQCKDPKQ